jgi:hypothetical protein
VNERLREFERESKLEIFGLGARREIWEKALEKYAELIVRECLTAIDKTDTTHIYTTFDQSMVMGTIEKSKKAVKEHFGLN